MEMQLSRDLVLNKIYDQYIAGVVDVDDTNPDKYAWMCGWLDKHNQYKRFEMLLAKVEDKDCIVDIGCGVGEMVNYLIEHNRDNGYIGVDVNPTYIATAKKRHPTSDFQISNGWNLPINNCDWAVASGIFTVMTHMTYLLWYVGFVMERLVNKGFAFNLLTNNPYDGLINYNPDEMKKILTERFPDYKIEIVTGYLPDDFTVYVTK